MSRAARITNEGKTIEIIGYDSAPEVFVDGISHAFIGFPCSKVLFHSVTPTFGDGDDISERRRVALHLTISTDVLAEMCRNMLVAIEEHSAHIEGRTSVYMNRLRGQNDPECNDAKSPRQDADK